LISALPSQAYKTYLQSLDSFPFLCRIGIACQGSWIDLNKKYKKSKKHFVYFSQEKNELSYFAMNNNFLIV
jgi:hypothetical protein